MMYKKFVFSWLVIGLFLSAVSAQDSVDVTFSFSHNTAPTVVGEFNGWDNTSSPMVYSGNNIWKATLRLRIGGAQGGSVPGAYQYKFYYSGASPWPNDPLNHWQNADDNNNSILYVKDPTIYHFLPNQRTGIEETKKPVITAYLFPKVGSVVDTSSIQLIIDDDSLYTNLGNFYNFSSKQLVFPVPYALTDGAHKLKLIAGDNADSVSFVIQEEQVALIDMPEYAQHAVTLPSILSNDSTTFRLRLADVNTVNLRISAAGHDPAGGDAFVMHKDPDSDNWWLNVDLEPGAYEYKYQTDKGAIFNDPWGRWNGENGSYFEVGPAGLTADDYVWKSTDFISSAMNKLIIYELHIAEFAGGYYGLGAGEAGFSDLAQLMAHFDSLGINAIELMPVNDYGLVGASGHSWGYDLNSYFALEPQFGTPYQFKALIDSAHAHGIAIILDVVFNHLNDTSPLWMMQPDAVANPYFKLNDDYRYNEDGLAFFKDMDHWTDETQELIYTSLKMWIDEYKVDGFRYDYTQGIGWNKDEPDKGVLGWANRIDEEYDGKIYQIAEHLPESPALIYYSGLTSGWHDSFRDEVFDEARFKNTSLTNFNNLVLDLGAYSGNDTPSSPRSYGDRTEPVNANVTHDEQSLIYEMTTFQGVSLEDAIQRDKLYATLIFTSKGIPMLWEGMEMSDSRGWHDEGEKLSYRPVNWALLDSERGKSHFEYYQALIRHRRYNPALYQGDLLKLQSFQTEKVLVWGFSDSLSGQKVMAIANFSSAEQTVSNVTWQTVGDWSNIFSGEILSVDELPLSSLTIPGYSALVFSNSPDSIALGINENIRNKSPFIYQLNQNYPNPFNPETVISYQLPVNSKVVLKIFDVAGREVNTLVNRYETAGNHSVSFNAYKLASGIYFYSLQAGNFVSQKKMLLIK